MALAFSQADIVRFKRRADSIISKGRALAEKHKDRINTVVTSTEVSAASFLFGLAQGKFGGISIVGVPVDLLAGLALHVLAFAGVGKGNAHHLHAFGDGALASFFNSLGRSVGRSIQTPTDRERIARSGVAGALDGVTGGASLADEELARMMAAGRK